MNIVGNGVDIVENNRIKILLKNGKFINRIFTVNEIKQSSRLKNKTNFYAKRFAAKEAFVKALGVGFRSNINFNDIEVKNDEKGKPNINLSNHVKNFIQKKFNLKNYQIFLSLADEKNYSIAYVIIEKKK